MQDSVLCDLPARHFWRHERDMAGLEMGLDYRIGGPPPYAVHLLAAARVILDAVVCFLPPNSSDMGQNKNKEHSEINRAVWPPWRILGCSAVP